MVKQKTPLSAHNEPLSLRRRVANIGLKAKFPRKDYQKQKSLRFKS